MQHKSVIILIIWLSLCFWCAFCRVWGWGWPHILGCNQVPQHHRATQTGNGATEWQRPGRAPYEQDPHRDIHEDLYKTHVHIWFTKYAEAKPTHVSDSEPLPAENGIKASGFWNWPCSFRKLAGLNSRGNFHWPSSFSTEVRLGMITVP